MKVRSPPRPGAAGVVGSSASKTTLRTVHRAAAAPLLSYVLHRYDWSESSLIVELFTRAQGRLVVAAKGAKRPTSQLRPVLMPFQPLNALLGKAPADEAAEVRNLRSAEWAGGSALLGAGSLLAGYYANELLLKLLARQDPHPALFDAYADTLTALAAADGDEEGDGKRDEAVVLRAFELLLLRELGWLPDLAIATLTTEPVEPDGRYTLHPEAGLTARSDGLPGATWVAIEAALAHARSQGSGRALRTVCSGVAGALRGPLRTLLHYHLGSSQLRTRQVWQSVQRLTESR